MNKYQVVCENIGTVYDGNNYQEALKEFRSYQAQSRSGVGRAGCEVVTLFRDDDVDRQHQPPTALSPLMIQGISVRDWAFLWATGGSPLHQWAGGATGVTQEVINEVLSLLSQEIGNDRVTNRRRAGLQTLLNYLREHSLCEAEKYEPDQWGYDKKVAAKYRES